MSRKPIAKIFITALCSPAFALAQTPVNPPQTTAAAPAPAVIGPVKIAWINLEQAILGCDEGKKEFGEVQKFAQKKTEEIQALQGRKLPGREVTGVTLRTEKLRLSA